jgi:hypothetical protein
MKFKEWVHNVADVTQPGQANIVTQLATAETEHINGETHRIGHQ